MSYWLHGMNYFDGGSGVLINAACKSGSTTCRTLFPTWDRPINGAEFSKIYLIVRNPRVRLLSAWRMYYEAPSRKWLRESAMVDYIKHTKYIRKHAASILDNPVHHFEHFCANNLEHFQTDAHFAPQWRDYRHLYLFHGEKIVLVNHHHLDDLLIQLGVTPRRENVQKWLWPNLSIADFFRSQQARAADRYYVEDAILWNRVDK